MKHKNKAFIRLFFDFELWKNRCYIQKKKEMQPERESLFPLDGVNAGTRLTLLTIVDRTSRVAGYGVPLNTGVLCTFSLSSFTIFKNWKKKEEEITVKARINIFWKIVLMRGKQIRPNQRHQTEFWPSIRENVSLIV